MQKQLQHGKLDASVIYTTFRKMGLDYGPSHQGIKTIYQGDGQILAELNLPATLESQENGYSHGSIGAYLIRKWKLPQNLEDSVRYHHSGHPKVNDSDQFQAVVLADTIVNMMNGHKNIRIDFQSIPTTIQEVMRQPLLEIRHWYPEVKKEIAQACELLLKER